VVAKFREDFYRQGHPTPADILVVIEVADTSLSYDLNAKVPLYAAAGIGETWLLDLGSRQLTVFSQPDGAVYTQSKICMAGDTVTMPGFPDVTLQVSELGL